MSMLVLTAVPLVLLALITVFPRQFLRALAVAGGAVAVMAGAVIVWLAAMFVLVAIFPESMTTDNTVTPTPGSPPETRQYIAETDPERKKLVDGYLVSVKSLEADIDTITHISVRVCARDAAESCRTDRSGRDKAPQQVDERLDTGGRIKVVLVSGDPFEIKPITNETQPLTELTDFSDWKWSVKAGKVGQLQLNVVATVLKDGSDQALTPDVVVTIPFKSRQTPTNVSKTAYRGVMDFITSVAGSIMTLTGATAGAYIIAKVRSRRKNAQETEESREDPPPNRPKSAVANRPTGVLTTTYKYAWIPRSSDRLWDESFELAERWIRAVSEELDATPVLFTGKRVAEAAARSEQVNRFIATYQHLDASSPWPGDRVCVIAFLPDEQVMSKIKFGRRVVAVCIIEGSHSVAQWAEEMDAAALV